MNCVSLIQCIFCLRLDIKDLHKCNICLLRHCRDSSIFFYQVISLFSEFALPMIVTLLKNTVFIHPAFS